ncbi:YwaF family protein [Mycoplasmopsis meleagridis]|uniref:YwaF family protein n=1 Tax=Mycoplasmopsis meleagridis TaxID=29561 RepID=UPI003A873DFA
MNDINYGFFSPAGTSPNSSWLGTPKIVFYIFSVIAVLILFLVWFLHNLIYRNYQNREKIIGLNKNVFMFLFGAFTIVGMFARSFILAINKYPYLWEILPLHLCRLMILFTAICLLINKQKWVKYFLPFSILGALLALFMPDMVKVQEQKVLLVGYDNFYYWDYILAHYYALIVPSIIYAINKNNYEFKDTLTTFVIFFILGTVMFLINYFTNVNSFVKENWKSNYFYLGTNEYNTLSELFGHYSHWPLNYVIYVLVIIVYILLYVFLFWAQSNFFIDKEEKKWIFKIAKNEEWENYKQSVFNFFKNKKKLTNQTTK